MTEVDWSSFGNDLKIRLYLKVGDTFYSESDIAENMQLMRDFARQKKINRETTDGAVSILYNGKELLGLDFWDEINWAMHSLASNLATFSQGKTIAEFLSMQSCWIKLTPKGDYLIYELERTPLKPINLRAKLPLKLFITEFFLMYFRMVRVLAMLGSNSSINMEQNWKKLIDARIAEIVDVDSIESVMSRPLEQVLAAYGQA